MRVLLTRPAPESARTKARLEALGHQVIVMPMLRICALKARWPDGAVDAVAATSAHAFASSELPVLPEARRLMPLFLVGERTEEAARRSGWSGPAIVAATATELVSGLAEIDRKSRVVYLAGRDRKPLLEDGLREQGHAVTTVEAYAALAAEGLDQPSEKALRDGAVDAVLHYSRRSAAIFLELATRSQIAITAMRHACLSADVAQPLSDAGCIEIHVATAPKESALIACLVSGADQA